MRQQNIETFLESHREGQFVSEGEFQLSPVELARKLGDTLAQPQNWVLKLVQTASALKAKRLTVKINRRWIRLELILGEHFQLRKAEELLNTSPVDRPHEHLLLGILCAANLYTSEEIRVIWTTAQGTISRVEVQDKNFEFSSKQGGETLTPFLGFALKRRPMTTMEKLFKKASFLPEYRVLQQRCRLYAADMFVDGRPLERCLQPEDAAHTSRVGLLIGSFETERTLNLPAQISERAELFPNEDETNSPEILLEVLYTDPLLARLPCLVDWVVDGVVIQEEQILPADTNVSLRLYLSANALKTDLSTFQLVEGQEKSQCLNSPEVRDWLSGALKWAEGHCVKSLAAPGGGLQQLFSFRLKRPVDRMSLREGLRKRRNDLGQVLSNYH